VMYVLGGPVYITGCVWPGCLVVSSRDPSTYLIRQPHLGLWKLMYGCWLPAVLGPLARV
jgi:hypothetical protein